MLNNIYTALERVGLSAHKRAIQIQFSNPYLNQQVLLQRIDGQHGINQGLSAELICLSMDATMALKQFIGSQVAVDTITDRGQLLRCSGIITHAAVGGSDGALTLYKLQLNDPTYLWQQRRNSRVFMGKSATEVIEIVFREWQQRSALFATSLTLDLSGIQKDYDVRPFIMQSNETDYDFLTRLMRQEGINWLIDEAQLNLDARAETIQAQKLRLIDDNSQYKALARRRIRFQRSSATERQDSITSFVGNRSLQSTAVHMQRWQADALEQEQGAGSVLSKHKHSDHYNNTGLGLESAWHLSPAWMQDLHGEDQATASGNSQIERFNQNMSSYFDGQAKQFTAHSTVRDTQVGYWFELSGHAEIDTHSGSDQEFLITSKSFYQQNNLPKDLNDQVQSLLDQSQWQLKNNGSNQERQANTLTLQRRQITIVPEYNPLDHRPAAHPQRAKVVGSSGEEIHVDEWGRIKLRFLFTRPDDHAHDGGAGSNDNDSDSAWVDVLTPWAGEGYGARFLPRIGEIVVVDFFDGNIDRPFVIGRIHEAQRLPTQFDIKGQLPETKKLSGIRSKEVGGEGFGQLRFDDTTGQISSQLQSSHRSTQLNLGNLSHPKVKPESEGRGEGFELRTDHSGAVRAGQGLQLSTYSQDQANGEHLEANAAQQQLESNLNHAKALSEVAKNQQTDPLEALDQLQGFIKTLEQTDPKKAAEFKSAIMLLAAPHSIAFSSHEDIHLCAEGQINHSAGESINISTQKNWIAHASDKISLFAAQKGIGMIAAKEKVEVVAQGNAMDLIARQGIQIISTEDSIYISSPKEICFKAAGSELKLNSSGVFSTTNRVFESKAGQHVFLGGEKISPVLPILPIADIPEKEIPKIRSTYAHDQLKFLAEQFEGHTFASIVQPIFGYDIPHSLYEQLRENLINGQVPSPKLEVRSKKIKGHVAAFDLKEGKILVAADLVLNAHHNENYNQMLYIALLEEYGHYIDWLLRLSGQYSLKNSYYYHIVAMGDTLDDLATFYKTTIDAIKKLNQFDDSYLVLSDYIKIPCELTKLEPDGYMDEGSIFAQHMANLDSDLQKPKYSLEFFDHVHSKTHIQELLYADVESSRYTGKLKIEYKSGKEAADLYASFMDHIEDNDGEFEFFGAGEGTYTDQGTRGKVGNDGKYILEEDNHSGVRESHGHESIILTALGRKRKGGGLLPNGQVMGIYAGNWLRDHSQIIVPAVLNFAVDIRIEGEIQVVYPNRDFLSRVLAILAYDYFFDDFFAHELLDKKDSLKVNLGKQQPLLEWIKKEAQSVTRFDHLPKDKQRRYKAMALIVYDSDKAMPLQLFTDLWRIGSGKGKDIVGVYKPQEHIDNPQSEIDARKSAKDLRYVDFKDFNPAPNQKSHKTNLDAKSPHYNLKNYIADSTPENAGDSAFPTALEYLLGQLDVSMSGSMTSFRALRALGNAFHVLEDFFAHTNFTEVALIKNGYMVNDHVQNPYKDYKQIPIVSGSFGFWDTVASIGPKIGEMIDPVKGLKEYKGLLYGERRLEDLLIQAAVSWLDIPKITNVWNTYLSMRDGLAGLNETAYLDKVNEIGKFLATSRTLAAIVKPIFSFLLQFAGSSAFKHSPYIIKLVQNKGNYGENPTHTQLAKDDQHNDLHLLAATLAIKAVESVGQRWIACRASPTAANKLAVKEAAKKYFVHPSKTTWMDADVREWAKANPTAIKNSK
ncbi:Rhs element Vgr protein [Acinetobacter calcoaceticus]|uniref:Rhs element Vgr protein n=1 Tax=Acinetobacter calcoaceticus TaxID=471 RepID=A0A4V2R191_ACICA|nr:Rhs element Vgr protein [Acinetobacter calcoaceticus]